MLLYMFIVKRNKRTESTPCHRIVAATQRVALSPCRPVALSSCRQRTDIIVSGIKGVFEPHPGLVFSHLSRGLQGLFTCVLKRVAPCGMGYKKKAKKDLRKAVW